MDNVKRKTILRNCIKCGKEPKTHIRGQVFYVRCYEPDCNCTGEYYDRDEAEQTWNYFYGEPE